MKLLNHWVSDVFVQSPAAGLRRRNHKDRPCVAASAELSSESHTNHQPCERAIRDSQPSRLEVTRSNWANCERMRDSTGNPRWAQSAQRTTKDKNKLSCWACKSWGCLTVARVQRHCDLTLPRPLSLQGWYDGPRDTEPSGTFPLVPTYLQTALGKPPSVGCRKRTHRGLVANLIWELEERSKKSIFILNPNSGF